MVAFTPRTFWFTILAISLATTTAAPVDSPVAPKVDPPIYTPPVTPSPEDQLKQCVANCLQYSETAFPSCAGRFTPEEPSPTTLCHTLGYICSHTCMINYNNK
ncbi:hypothetical protein BGZ81_002829 [Podila clonocystis]|nr:hypothetical protein BGZ81_002829 [Podila clonocystis]